MHAQDPEELRRRIAGLRAELRRDIADASQEVQHAMHWQYYVKKFPFLCAGAAFLAGYALIPTRKPAPVVATDKQIKELAEAGKLHLVSEAASAKDSSVAQRAALALGTVAARAGMAYLGKVIGQQGKAD